MNQSSKCIWLSHTWGPSSPAYGDGKRILIEPATQISRGDSSNSLSFSAGNHIGSHMDAPYHFSENGRKVDSYAAEDFYFKRPILVDLTISDTSRHITEDHLVELRDRTGKQFLECDLLLFRTGLEKNRQETRYWSDGIGMGPGTADFLRKHAPQCRAIGLDTISVTAFSQRELGRQVHREFLQHDKPFILFEDLALQKADAHGLSSVVAAPLRIEGGDGAPVTVMGFYQ